MRELKKRVLIGVGWTLVATGIAIAPLPGPGGVPVIAAGAYVLIRNSASARRFYVRAKRRWPGAIAPLDRTLRRRKRPASSG
jgi:hypothetical protein